MPVRKPSKRRLSRQLRKLEKKKKSKFRVPFKLVIPLAILVTVFLILSFTTKHWNGSRKLTLVVAGASGDVSLITFDPVGDSLTRVVIPSETEVSVARQLGRWRIRNVQKLGEKEGIAGKLLTETVTRHFKFPTYIWAEKEGLGFSGENFTDLINAAFSPYKTNLGFGDRLRLLYFSFNVKNFKKETIELKDTRYLKEMDLLDGEPGFVVVGSVPADIIAVFADPSLNETYGRTKIIDRTEGGVVGKSVGEIAEILGLKVISVSKETVSEMDCSVSGKSEQLVDFVAKLFDCEVDMEVPSDLEVVITLGSSFEKRY